MLDDNTDGNPSAHIQRDWIKHEASMQQLQQKNETDLLCWLLGHSAILSLSNCLPLQWDSLHTRGVLCLISCFSLKSAQLSPLYSPPPSYFLHPPSPSFIYAPSSHPPPSYFFFSFALLLSPV